MTKTRGTGNKAQYKMIYLETLTNPQLELIDLEWAGQLAKSISLF